MKKKKLAITVSRQAIEVSRDQAKYPRIILKIKSRTPKTKQERTRPSFCYFVERAQVILFGKPAGKFQWRIVVALDLIIFGRNIVRIEKTHEEIGASAN